ncbi:helix-turn-helix domain-containing protein [Mycoplasma sp. P36-A1]|uniref:helix-turn-helix domain-containing protein n=1 Tax=Mycoplasma sp. P36-A1 TaxID=3252900 RepID=UPI003C2CFCF0
MSKVGNQLREKRESLGLSIDDVVNQTKIQKVYVDAIESNDFSFFQNQDFYQQVFVGRYADFLSMDKNAILSALQDDRNDYTAMKEKKAKEIKEKQNISADELLPKEPLIPKQFKRSSTIEDVQDVQNLTNEEVSVEPQAELHDSNVLYEAEEELLEEPILPETEKVEEVDEQFNQLLEEINQNVNVDNKDYFDEYDNQEIYPEDEAESEFLAESDEIDQESTHYENDLMESDSSNEDVEETTYEKQVEDLTQPLDDGSELEIEVLENQTTEPHEQVEVSAEDEYENNLMNDSIFAEIDKINQDVEATRIAKEEENRKAKEEAEIASYSHNEPEAFDFDKISNELQNTQVIDLTKGIDLETINQPNTVVEDTVGIVAEDAQPVTEPATVVEEKNLEVENISTKQVTNPTISDLENRMNQSSDKADALEETTKLDDLVAEKGLNQSNNTELEQVLNLKTRPRKNEDAQEETKQMKVAKALGDNNGVVDEAEEAKIKRAKIIDAVLIVLIILLLCYLFYLLLTNKIF